MEVKNLVIESYEIAGAIKLLQILQRDWKMSIVPMVEGKYISKGDVPEPELKKEYRTFVNLRNTGYRRMLGEAMIEWLLNTENMRRFLCGGMDEIYAEQIKNKKGVVIGIKFYTK